MQIIGDSPFTLRSLRHCKAFFRKRLDTAKMERIVVLLMLATSLLLCVAITNQSLWIDEAVIAYFASYDRLTNLFVMLTNLRTSDPQMPLYILYLWGWAKLFGTSEYA